MQPTTEALFLTDRAGALSGSLEGTVFSGTLASGQRSGSAVGFTATSTSCTFEVVASLELACLMTGMTTCLGFDQQSSCAPGASTAAAA